eukprot:scaffold34676_cov176-Amphora_coffeaeformis.AAC.2
MMVVPISCMEEMRRKISDAKTGRRPKRRECWLYSHSTRRDANHPCATLCARKDHHQWNCRVEE